MSSLFKRLYLTVLASLLLFALLVGVTIKLFADPDRIDRSDQIMLTLVKDLLPAELSSIELNDQLARWSKELKLDLAVYVNGSAVSVAGNAIPRPDADVFERVADGEVSWRRPHGRLVIAIPLDEARALIVAPANKDRFGGGAGFSFAVLLAVLALIGVAVAIAVFPSARRLTRRLEQLQASMDAFGAGDLSARATIKGKDDFARLADHFNQSADRIADLLRAQKSLLANASHELRSPLARIRMAVALFNQPGLNADTRAGASAELLRNVSELDELVDEVLTASRLDASSAGVNSAGSSDPWETFDLGGLVAEECARLSLSPSVSSQEVEGDRRLLRRLVRNLLENAKRYGQSSSDSDDPISVVLAPATVAGATQLQLSVCDRGPGVPADEAERIFEPFYRARGASEKSGGVGLGLSLVKQIALHHRGQVYCEPRPGGGTCFQVLLPAPGGGMREPETTG